MSKEKLSSQEITDIVASKASVSKRASEEFLKVMISTIEEALQAGDSVKIKNFGTFKLQWNEPRKSVNVKTGESIILDGYYKVSFAPDANLRDLVNEPFAHLEAVNLNGEIVESVQKEPEGIDPLRTLNNQASEIKDILTEIMNLQQSGQNADLQDEIVQILSEEYIIEDEIPHQLPEENIPVVENDPVSEIVELKNEPVEEVHLPEPIVVVEKAAEAEGPTPIQHQPEAAPAAEVVDNKGPVLQKKKSRVWLWLLIAVVMLAAGTVGLYSFYPPANKTMSTVGKSISVFSSEKFTDFLDWLNSKPKKKEVPVTIVIPKDTSAIDEVEEEEIVPVDSLQLLFDNPRIYSEIIATETIRSGNRLTIMAKKYYGLKDFWVYIYEANREKINDPDKIPTGTIINIPKLDPRLIDKNNQRCVNKAKELHDLYVKRTTKEE